MQDARAIVYVATDAELPRSCGAERLAGTAKCRVMGRDPACYAARQRCRRLGRRASRADAIARAFDGFVELSKRVSPTCLISFERNRYSVPAAFANRPVSLRIYPNRLVVAAEGQILCEHVRVIQRSHQLPPRAIYDWRHYLAVLQRKPGALRNGAPFAEFPSLQAAAGPHAAQRPGWSDRGDGRDPGAGFASR